MRKQTFEQYEISGHYVELCTIPKETSSGIYRAALLQIQNTFYEVQHSAIVNLWIAVSSIIRVGILSKKDMGVAFDVYTYDDGTLLHIYIYVVGGNGVGDVSLYYKPSSYPKELINIIFSQHTTIPEGAVKVE